MSEQFEMHGNESGWLCVFLHLEESTSLCTVTQRGEDGRGQVVYHELEPFETVRLLFVAGKQRKEYRVVAKEDGSLTLDVPECLVNTNPGGGLDIKLGEAQQQLEIDAANVTETQNE